MSMTYLDTQALTERLISEGEIITERLDHWAALTPDRTFFYYGEDGTTLSYGEFGTITDHIAGNLAAQGIQQGDRVSVFSTNPLMATQMMFGIWKAGAVYAPVNYSFTGRLLSYQLNDTAPRLVVTDAALLQELNDVAGDLDELPAVAVYESAVSEGDSAVVDERFSVVAWHDLTAPAERPDITVKFSDPANIVYTSGTTGPSKGVVQPYRWMAQYTFNLRQPLSADDVIYNDLPLYHVGGALANVGRAAWVGCEVAVWDRFSPTEFWSRIQTRGVTTAIMLDVMIPWLMKAPVAESDQANTLNKVHMQPLPVHHNEFARRFGIDTVAAGFGQTESGAPIGVFIEELAEGEGTPEELYRGRSRAEMSQRMRDAGVPVLSSTEVTRKGLMGSASPFFEVAILDDDDTPCPAGRVGHLALRPKLPGIILSEYLGKPDKTVEAWRNLWFHTGDAAIQQSDGMFDYVDRLGDRIRVRGENLSSFQVEDVLNQHENIQLCAAFGIPSDDGDEDDVVAYVVPVEGADLSEAEVRTFAENHMPKFMRPRYVRVVADIPRTPTNKVEKYKLRSDILSATVAASVAGIEGDDGQ